MKLRLTLGALCALAGAARADDPDAEMGRRVQVLLRAHQAEVFGCVAKQAGAVEGEALLRVVVGSPTAQKVEVLKLAPEAVRPVAECVAGVARRWDLSALGAAPGDQLVFPLAFHPDKPGSQDRAVEARLRKLSLRKHDKHSASLEHPTAWFVVRGGVAFRQGDVLVTARPGDLAYASGGPVELVSEKGSELIVVEAIAAPPTSSPLQLRAARAIPYEPLVSGPRVSGWVRLFLHEVPAPFAVEHLCNRKGAEVPRHTHESDELLYILSGRARTTLGDRTDVEQAGDFVTIPRGTPHALTVEKDLCAVQVYAPAGPEQRFRAPTSQPPKP